MLVGAVEDIVKSPSLATTKAQLDLARLAGFDAIRVTQLWNTGDRKPAAADVHQLRNVAGAARIDGMTMFVSILSPNGRTAPNTAEERDDFAAFAAAVARDVSPQYLIVGNEPNLPRFWLPQFNADGSDAAAPAYEALLAKTYDAVKAATKKTAVLGGAVSPHGSDDPNAGTKSHSPTTFIRDLGAAYRASGRKKRIMDGFVIHPYEDNSSIEPVKGTHPRSTSIAIADYDKLEALLAEAFDGTAQPGSKLPVYYGEFGLESIIPPKKAGAYTGTEPRTIHPIDEATQGAYYREAVQLAFCQPNVRALLFFHTRDEKDLDRWQSGVFYVDGTPKASLRILRAAISEQRRGVVAKCAGLHLTPRATATLTPRGLKLACDIDCTYAVVRGHRTTRGRAIGGHAKLVRLRNLRPGQRVRVRLTAPVNPGPARVLVVTR